MNILPWRNRNEMVTFRSHLDDLFQRFFTDDFDWTNRLPAAFAGARVPAMDMAETEKAWTVSLELPGLEEKDIQVQVLGNSLVISGERKWEQEKKGKEFHRVESQFGSFQRTIPLPENARLDPDSITATYKKGILELSIPKVEPTPAARIPVRAG